MQNVSFLHKHSHKLINLCLNYQWEVFANFCQCFQQSKWNKSLGEFYVVEFQLFFLRNNFWGKEIFACAQDRQDLWSLTGLFWLNQSAPANSPSSLKDSHEYSHHEALVFCSTSIPGIKCTHHRGAGTWSRTSCSRASVLQGSGERCKDRGHSSPALG